MFKTAFALSAILLQTAFAAQADQIGFHQTTADPDSARPVDVTLWYPTDDPGIPEIVGENNAFVGITALRDAKPQAGSHPVVLLSHGYGGSWRNLSWLAGKLVDQGYVVIAVDHSGTTTFNRDAEQAAMLWERPRDLSRALDAVLDEPDFAGNLDPDRVAAIGHSLGGWTVAELAGARFDPALFARDCEAGHSPRACALSAELGLGKPEIGQDLRDPRVKAFVTLDLGLARGFSPGSLAQVEVPALIYGAGVDIGGLPATLESGWLAEHLPQDTSRLEMVPDAMHFSFMQLCKPGAEALIEAEVPGDGIVCRDGGSRGRAAIHDAVAAQITGFLSQSLTP